MSDGSAFEAVAFDICDEILRIMETYDEQVERNGYPDTPGGLEHMGDVWSLFYGWRERLIKSKESGAA